MCPRTPLPSLILLCLCSLAPAAEPKRDCYGDPLPEGAIARLGNLPLRHEGGIQSAAFTADGKTLVICEPLSFSFWDPATGKCVRSRPLDRSVAMEIMRLSDDARILMLGDFKNVLHFIDTASGAEQGTLNHARCGSIWGWPYLSRDGKILAAIHRFPPTDQTSIAVWDVERGKLLHEFKEPPLGRVAPHGLIALTPDGKQLILPHADGSLHLVDVASGKEIRAFEMPPPRSRTAGALRFSRLSLSPDGRYLAFGGPVTPWTVCEVATGKRLCQLEPAQSPNQALAFTPNGRFLAVASPLNEIRLIGVLSGKEIRKLSNNKPAHSQMLVFSPDGRTLADFPSGSTIHLWDVVAGRRLHPPVGHELGVQALAFFPDGKRLVSADGNGDMLVWNIASGQPLAQRVHNRGTVSLTVDRDGETVRFAGNDCSVHEWDLRTGHAEVWQRVSDVPYTNLLALSPDGRSLAILVPNGGVRAQRKGPVTSELRLYDLKTNKSIVLPRPTEQSWVGHLTFTPDSRRLAASCADGVLRLWDRDTGKLVRDVQNARLDGSPVHLAFAPDGRSFIALMRNKLRLREIASGADRLQIPPVPNMFSLAYSPDARFIACGGWDGRILVYSAVSGDQLAQWQGNQGYIHALAFSRDGRLLASGGHNGTILIWEVPKHERSDLVLKEGDLDSFWLELGDRDAPDANHALAGFAAAPEQTLPFFRKQLSAIGKQLEGSQYADLIAKLDDDSFKVREKAMRELALAGADAADALRRELNNSPSAEVKRRIEDLLGRLKTGGYSQRLRFLRALEVLERIGSPQAKNVLRSLVGQSLPPDLREEVQASLSRLGGKP